ncbi:hypothetical protein TSOC_015092, partial [Tetrabaena socialis]
MPRPAPVAPPPAPSTTPNRAAGAPRRRQRFLHALEERRLALLALAVRAALLLAATALDALIPDYDTSKHITPYDIPPSSYGTAPAAPYGAHGAALQQAQAPLAGWLVWDSVFFADISARGYVYEQYYAFFPVLP